MTVGPFPRRPTGAIGGTLTSGQLLLNSSFATRFELLTIDTTQRKVPAPSLPVRALHAVGRTARFVWLLETKRPDAALLFAALGASVVEKCACAWYAKIRGVPTLLFLRGGAFMDHCQRSALYRRFAAVLLRGANVLLCQSDTWRRFFMDTFGASEQRCPIVPNWTATPDLVAVGAARDPAPRSGPLTLVYMGWLQRDKGVFDLLEAFRLLSLDSSFKGWTLLLAGEGKDFAEAREWVRQSGLESRVRFLGWIRGEDKAQLLRDADLFVLPSHAEGVSNAVIEAMSAGVPVVVTAVGGLPGVVRNDVHGRLAPPHDPPAFADAIRDVTRDRERLAAMGVAAHMFAARTFSLEPAVIRLSEVIERATRQGDIDAPPQAEATL